MSADEGTQVKIVDGADDICQTCPHLKAGVCTRPGENIQALDRRVLARLSLKQGDFADWFELRERVRAGVRPGDLAGLCGGCRWRSLNFCAEGLEQLAAGSQDG
ncbi:MAG: DUF1284 domain-containing protein [Actinobacteria bacterium]|nr:DUF1284 domain-containing protein [Actinomycetota bacterium]MCL6093493.1 DUF1284 domain-containing protein [Actinomycetota bacterium]